MTVIDNGENIGGGVETGSTGERDMHSDATSQKHAAPTTAPEDDDVPKQEDRSSSASNVDVRTDKDSHGGSCETDSSNSAASQMKATGHASDFQSAEGLASDMPDRKGIHTPASSGDRATDITGIPYIQ